MPRAPRVLLATLVAVLALTGVAGLPGASPIRAAGEVFDVVPDGGAPRLEEGGWLPGRPVSDRLACKPRGPMATELDLRGVAVGGRVEFGLDVAARTELTDLAWRLRVPAGTAVLSGALEGRGGSARVTLRLPEPVGGEPVSVTLVATARLPSGDRVEVRDTLHWGARRVNVPERRVVGTTRVAAADLSGGTGSDVFALAHAVADVPTRHRWGR